MRDFKNAAPERCAAECVSSDRFQPIRRQCPLPPIPGGRYCKRHAKDAAEDAAMRGDFPPDAKLGWVIGRYSRRIEPVVVLRSEGSRRVYLRGGVIWKDRETIWDSYEKVRSALLSALEGNIEAARRAVDSAAQTLAKARAEIPLEAPPDETVLAGLRADAQNPAKA